MKTILLGLCCLALCLSAQTARADIIPRDPYHTFAVQKAHSDAFVILRWDEKLAKGGQFTGPQLFEVVEVLKNSKIAPLKKGDVITRAWWAEEKPPKLACMTRTSYLSAKKEKKLTWSLPRQTSPEQVSYIRGTPDSDLPARERLVYFFKYLNHSDSVIATDAYVEVVRADYQDLAAVADQLPRTQLKKMLSSPRPGHNIRYRDDFHFYYGLMLGLCGKPEDAAFLEAQILKLDSRGQPCSGRAGMIAGYLLITGPAGLSHVEKTLLLPKYLTNAAGDVVKDLNDKPRSGHTHETMDALLLLWEHEPEKFPKDRLRQSMRLLLDRPDIDSLAIAVLADWKDWSVQDRLLKKYRELDSNPKRSNYHVRNTKRRIIQYLLLSTYDTPKHTRKLSEQARKGKRHIEAIRHLDKELVERESASIRQYMRNNPEYSLLRSL